ncbi:MAG: glycosyltransferase [Fibrobacteria bacterium]|nr:glycosyltransferase [Fibrobacteria bacterium]
MSWLRHTDFDVVVVDYSCPDGTAAWIAAQNFGERVKVAHHVAEAPEGRRLFNPARARNVGARAAEGEYLLFVDADVHLHQGFQAWLEEQQEPGTIQAVVNRPSSLFGILGVRRAAFLKVGGYDEGFTGWGGEDLDLRIRLHLQGLRCAAIPEKLVRSVPHSNRLRARNTAEPDFTKARQRNSDYFRKKIWEMTGRTFAEWLEDPAVDCLLRHPTAPPGPVERGPYR